jgi:drug/metabolite transporter (DMT)-like permease
VGSKVAYDKGNSVPTVLFYSSLICCLGLMPFCDLPSALDMTFSDMNILLLIVGTGIFVTLLPFMLFNYSLKKIEAGKASIITYVEPIAATIVGFIVYNEGVTIDSVIGIILIFIALVAVNRNVKTEAE